MTAIVRLTLTGCRVLEARVRVLLRVALVGVVFAIPGAAYSAEELFPLRSTYTDVRPLSTREVALEFGDTAIVDVRSEFEYEVIHIRGAINNPIARSSFDDELAEIAKDGKKTRLIFYCNGHTCAKSYKAVRRAAELGYRESFAYDAGIFEWTRSHPDKAVLLGESPADPSKLIPKAELAAHMLEAERFLSEARAESAILIDARDPMQRKKTPDFGDKEVGNYYMAKLARVLASDGFHARAEGRPLYIFDATGKQVRWLQYHLESEGYRDYWFLEGGVWSLFGADGAN